MTESECSLFSPEEHNNKSLDLLLDARESTANLPKLGGDSTGRLGACSRGQHNYTGYIYGYKL